MPLYEYHCDDCDHQFEALQGIHARPGDLPCPQCGARNLNKLHSSFAASTGTKTSAAASSACGGAGFT